DPSAAKLRRADGAPRPPACLLGAPGLGNVRLPLPAPFLVVGIPPGPRGALELQYLRVHLVVRTAAVPAVRLHLLQQCRPVPGLPRLLLLAPALVLRRAGAGLPRRPRGHVDQGGRLFPCVRHRVPCAQHRARRPCPGRDRDAQPPVPRRVRGVGARLPGLVDPAPVRVRLRASQPWTVPGPGTEKSENPPCGGFRSGRGREESGGYGWTRTTDPSIMSAVL